MLRRSVVCAATLLARIRVRPRPEGAARASSASSARAGTEFTSRTWLWATVLLFGISGTSCSRPLQVLGPVIAKADLGGAGAWATILAAGGVGAVIGGVVAHAHPPFPAVARRLRGALAGRVPAARARGACCPCG